VERTESVLSIFSSIHDSDIERFIKSTAIGFSNQGIARTHLVMAEVDGSQALLGYFTLANKVLAVPREYLSKTVEKRLSKYGVLDETTGCYTVPMPLIAQLGKNYTDGLSQLLSGDDLLSLACGKVADIQAELGGKFTYLECEDTPKLTEFYSRNGFIRTDGSRPADEHALIQMIKYL
jgi:hypothetical protein